MSKTRSQSKQPKNVHTMADLEETRITLEAAEAAASVAAFKQGIMNLKEGTEAIRTSTPLPPQEVPRTEEGSGSAFYDPQTPSRKATRLDLSDNEGDFLHDEASANKTVIGPVPKHHTGSTSESITLGR